MKNKKTKKSCTHCQEPEVVGVCQMCEAPHCGNCLRHFHWSDRQSKYFYCPACFAWAEKYDRMFEAIEKVVEYLHEERQDYEALIEDGRRGHNHIWHSLKILAAYAEEISNALQARKAAIEGKKV